MSVSNASVSRIVRWDSFDMVDVGKRLTHIFIERVAMKAEIARHI